MWQLTVEGGRRAAWKTHGVKADADRKHVCVLMGQDACLYLCDYKCRSMYVHMCEAVCVRETLCVCV